MIAARLRQVSADSIDSSEPSLQALNFSQHVPLSEKMRRIYDSATQTQGKGHTIKSHSIYT